MGEEGFNLRCAHDGRVAEFVEADEAFVPMEIGLFGADGIAAQADGLAEAVGEFSLWHDGAGVSQFGGIGFRGDAGKIRE